MSLLLSLSTLRLKASTGTKSFLEVVHKQPSKAPREATISVPADGATPASSHGIATDVGEAVTPLQRAILAAIGHAASEDAAARRTTTTNGEVQPKENGVVAEEPASVQPAPSLKKTSTTSSAPKGTTTTKSSAKTNSVTSTAKILSPEHLETELNKKLKRQGFFRAEEVLSFFEALKLRGHCSGRQAKFLIGAFGSRMSLDRAGKKMNALEEVWKTLPFLGVVYTVDHYNAALRVLIENEESFSPIQVLLEMESQGKKTPKSNLVVDGAAVPPRCASATGVRRRSAGDSSAGGEFRVEPDRNTFELFIALFCQEGRVEAVGPILNHMQSKNLLVGENILNSLVYGHVKVGDEATTRRILGLMTQSGIPTTVSTVEAILCGYAESGDILKMSMIIREVRRKGVEKKDVDLKEILGGNGVEDKQRPGAESDAGDGDSGVIIASSPTALTPPNVMPSFDFDVHSMPLIDNQALLSSILALVKCGHGEHLKVIANHIVVDVDTPVVFLHQFRNALFHLLIEGYKRESFALLGHFAVKTVGIEKKKKEEDTGATSSSGSSSSSEQLASAKGHSATSLDFFQVRDDLIRTFVKAVLDQKLSLEEFLQLFSAHLFELDANVATLVLQKNIDLISKCYSESELVFLS